jgi:FKBP-type peptidyl-prolyl cis-trans isomerase FklB
MSLLPLDVSGLADSVTSKRMADKGSGAVKLERTTMKLRFVSSLLAAGMSMGLFAAEVELKTEKDRISYAIGVDIGRNITNRQVEVNTDALAAGLKATISGGKQLLTQEQLEEAMTALKTTMQAKMAEQMKSQQAEKKEAGEKNKKEGEKFLAENKTKEGVKTTASGLQYKVMTAGTGPKPTSNDTVVVHYRGTLLDGKEFDSSYKRGEPMEFPVTQVIKGWTEALLMMPVGSKWQIYIPSELGYGERGTGRDIGPNSVLQFDVELVSIKPKDGKAESK